MRSDNKDWTQNIKNMTFPWILNFQAERHQSIFKMLTMPKEICEINEVEVHVHAHRFNDFEICIPKPTHGPHFL